VKLQSQGHKTLMYGTWVHVRPKAKIHNMDKENQTMKSWKSIHKDMKPMHGKKLAKILKTWTLLACFFFIVIGFFLCQNFLVDYQQLWFYFLVQKMVMPPRVWSSSTCTSKTTILITSGREFQTYELVVCNTKITVATCMKESKKGKGGEEK